MEPSGANRNEVEIAEQEDTMISLRQIDRREATCPKGATDGEHQMESPKTVRVLASVFSMGAPVTGGRQGRPTETTQRVGRSPTERRQRGRQPDERRIRQGISQVAGEAVGHLALLIQPPAEAVLRPVRFIRPSRSVVKYSFTTELLESRSKHRPQKLLQTQDPG